MHLPDPARLIADLAAADRRLVMVAAGGGALAISHLVTAPGSTGVVLAAEVPSARAAVDALLGGPQESYCSSRTARRLAVAAWQRASRLERAAAPAELADRRAVGVAVTGSLRTTRPKRGPHRVCVAVQTLGITEVAEIELEKEARSRAEEEALAAALPAILRVLGSGTHWERHVWTLTPSPSYDQHPHRHAVTPWPETTDPEEFARQCYLRAERQTFIPVPDAQGLAGRQTLFTIRVMVEPLCSAVRSASDALRLHDALASMSGAVLAYKNLATARPLLLEWLARRSANDSTGPAALV